MKRIRICLLCAFLLIGFTTGCSSSSNSSNSNGVDQATDSLLKDSETEKQEGEVITSVWDGTIADGFSGGAGMTDDPYLICSAEELAYLAQLVNDGKTYQGQCYKLCCDVVMNSAETLSESFKVDEISSEQFESYQNSDSELNLWTPIGTETNPFRGIFDGDSHTISGMAIVGHNGGTGITTGIAGNVLNYQKAGYAGLFGFAENAVIKNLQFENAAVFADTYTYTGIVLGEGHTKSNNTLSIYNCSTDASCVVYNYTTECGGICGRLLAEEGVININQCVNNGRVIAGTGCGGIVSGASGEDDYGYIVQITFCANTGRISGYEDVGGIVGHVDDYAIVSNCYNIGDIPEKSSESGNNYGNIAGWARDSMVIHCYMTADNSIEAVGYDYRNNTIDVTVVPASYLEDNAWVQENIGTFSNN